MFFKKFCILVCGRSVQRNKPL